MPMMRSVLIALSRSRALQNAVVHIPFSRRMARRFVAGESLPDALAVVQQLNAQGVAATLDHLGENVASEDEAWTAANEYLLALDAIYLADADSNVSIKLTQMGLDLGQAFCYENMKRIISKAAECGNFVRIDMEGAEYTERTIALYRLLRREFDNVGIAVQSYLYRSQSDVEALIAEGIGHFRLMKGAYDEPESIAYKEHDQVTQAMNRLVSTCLAANSLARGTYCAVASHDEHVINFTRALVYQQDVPRHAYEFQMLYGIRRELQAQLVREGDKVRVYVPYGTHWYPYFMRRLAERPANLLFFLRALVGD